LRTAHKWHDVPVDFAPTGCSSIVAWCPRWFLRMDIPDTSRNVGIQGFIQVQASSNVHILYVHCVPTMSVLLLDHVTASGGGHSRRKKCDAKLRSYYYANVRNFRGSEKSLDVKLSEVNRHRERNGESLKLRALKF
jgi:hypothetical protein